MRKRGAKIRHRNAMIPGLIAQAACPEYETRLRLAVDSLRDGWMGVSQFDDLADTIDLLRIGLASCGYQKPDPSSEVACEAAYIALMNVRQRYLERGKFGATGEELAAIKLLADVSLDYWNRRSGALFHFAVLQLRELRAEQNKEFKEQQEQQRKAA